MPVFPSPAGKHHIPVHARRHNWAVGLRPQWHILHPLPLLLPTGRLWAFKVTGPAENSRAVFWWPKFLLSHLSSAFLLFNLLWVCCVACFCVSPLSLSLGLRPTLRLQRSLLGLAEGWLLSLDRADLEFKRPGDLPSWGVMELCPGWMLTPALTPVGCHEVKQSRAWKGGWRFAKICYLVMWISLEWLTRSPRILDRPSSLGWSVPSASILHPSLCSSGGEDPPWICWGVRFRSFYFFSQY